ncbi:MAG TPA: helix-turn-helix transcriptional regulator [Trebonia sp.]|jgi:transcriptional regulator with XRE-family HTH domain|nr:helix-turn-helix transcriptional regulator [Trebonia sp.]
MAVNTIGNPATHFGKQMKKERLARGWSLREFAAHTGINIGHASRIENGKRPPTEKVAAACDAAFPERRGWFGEYYEELSTWSEVPAAFKDWTEREDSAATLRVWSPGIVHGLLQTEAYARALLSTYPGVTSEAVSARLAARMARQRRLSAREVPTWFIVDELSLYRQVGSPAIMTAQMRHILTVATMPNVTLQVLPAVAHPATGSEIIVADDSAYAEHAAGGFVYTGETVTALARTFDSVRSECRKASESTALLERMAEAWTGGSPLTAAPTGDRA